MNEHRNMILAIVLSLLVLVGWSFVAERWFPTAHPQTQKVENGKVKPLAPPSTSPAAPQALQARSAVIASTPRVRFQNSSISGSINLRGARIDDLVMLKHRVTISPKSGPVPLLSPQGAKAASFVGFGWSGDGVAVPGPDTIWQANGSELAPGKPLALTWTNPAGLRFEIDLAIDDQYLFTVAQKVTNGSAAPVAVRPYLFASRAGRSHDVSSPTVHVGPIRVADGKADYEVSWQKVREAGPALNFSKSKGWIGFTDKYWLTALIPNGGTTNDFRHSDAGPYQADAAADQQIVQPGQTLQFKSQVFSGAKEKKALDGYENGGIELLSKSIDWGWFEWFMRPIFNLLNWLFKVTGNFGVAIICLTLIVRGLMFPVADRQFRSMAGMRRIQPKLKAIQERYKDDKVRLQQEMLKLYQQEKINPAAGCLPILLQIPVFYALYKVLMVSVEMRHQPFALWIHDLSAPDPATVLNLFGLLNFTPHGFLAIGVLPILLGVTMFIQFKLNPQQMDPVQQQMFSIMPWILMFVMAPFAAGLQLYWTVSNILTICQQWWLYKRYDLHYSDTHPVKT